MRKLTLSLVLFLAACTPSALQAGVTGVDTALSCGPSLVSALGSGEFDLGTALEALTCAHDKLGPLLESSAPSETGDALRALDDAYADFFRDPTPEHREAFRSALGACDALD